MMEKLPVIISGAGPCGLVCAVVLKKHGVPFVVVERVSNEKLTADVGSGFDMAPTAVRIFDYLQLPKWRERMDTFVGVNVMGMSGKGIRLIKTTDLPGKEAMGAKRSALQQCLRDKLEGDWVPGVTAHLGASIVAHEEAEDGSKVTVELSTGVRIEGRALLACEGWRSKTRTRLVKCSDPIHFNHVAMWWGKCDVTDDLAKLIKETQPEEKGHYFLWFMGDGSDPGNFVAAPSDGGQSIMWSSAMRCDTDPAQSDDLTIRGGVRGSDVKSELEAIVKGRSSLIRAIVAATPGQSVTKVGLYDRENQDVGLVSERGLVALLGDAAHPQTPFMGQGCNMAIADAFAVCTRLGSGNGGDPTPDVVRQALACLQSPERKAFVKKTVLEARRNASFSTSKSTIVGFIFRKLFEYAPSNLIFPRVDANNLKFVNQALLDCGDDPLAE